MEQRKSRPDIRDIFSAQEEEPSNDENGDEVIVHEGPNEDIPSRDPFSPPAEMSPSTSQKVAHLQEAFKQTYANGRMTRKAQQERFRNEDSNEEEGKPNEGDSLKEEEKKIEDDSQENGGRRKWYSKFRTLPRYTSSPKKSDSLTKKVTFADDNSLNYEGKESSLNVNAEKKDVLMKNLDRGTGILKQQQQNHNAKLEEFMKEKKNRRRGSDELERTDLHEHSSGDKALEGKIVALQTTLKSLQGDLTDLRRKNVLTHQKTKELEERLEGAERRARWGWFAALSILTSASAFFFLWHRR